jgi:SAM-dependent methyltransferase
MYKKEFRELLVKSTTVALTERKAIEKRLAKEAAQNIEVLQELLAGESVALRRAAVEILRRIAGANDRALQLLKERLGVEPDVKTRRRLAAAIGYSGQTQARDMLLEQLEREEHRFVQASLILALGKVGFHDWPAHWVAFLDKEGPVAEAMRKAASHSAKHAQISHPPEGSRRRPDGTYFFQIYPGLEKLVRLELRLYNLAQGQSRAPGWLALPGITGEALTSLEHLRTIMADYCLALKVPVMPGYDIQAVFGKATRTMLDSAPYLGEGCTFRLSLPTMQTRDDYRKLVVNLSRRLEQATGWRNNPSDYDVDLRLVRLHSTEVIIWRDRRWPSPRLNEKRQVVPASLHPSVAAALCFAAAESELEHIMPSGGKGRVLLDPCCGAGTILSEWLSVFPQAQAIGYDISEKAIQRSQSNLDIFKTRCQVRVADMRHLPLKDSSVDFIVCNLPFGVRVKHESSNRALYASFVAEASRILRSGGWLVTYTADRQAIESALRSAGWRNELPLTKVMAGGLEVTIHRVQKST